MLSKQDYLGFLKEMFDIEMKMLNFYSDLEKKLNDSKMKDLFCQLALDEKSHASAVDGLVELIKQKYPNSSK
ncbi:MAG: hypothetical protein WC330_03135 [Candidatus Omnitrophota bacterium]|jgi:rubrerythrin